MSDIQKHKQPTGSERFLSEIKKQFTSAVGTEVDFTPYQKKLGVNLFTKTDMVLEEQEARRIQKGNQGAPITWDNVNIRKLAIDAVHRINIGLDAMIDNHIQIIPRWNSKLGKYDLSLDIGFRGKDYYRREVAVEKPVDIIYDLVYSNDDFIVVKKGAGQIKDHYVHEVPEPFNRGEIIGGYGYIEFEDETKNKLVIVEEKDFKKRESKAKTSVFWEEWPMEMRLKTLAHITTSHLRIDPKKVNSSYYYVEAQEKSEQYDEPEPDHRQLIDISLSEEYSDMPDVFKYKTENPDTDVD